jgi:hypothetical protein
MKTENKKNGKQFQWKTMRSKAELEGGYHITHPEQLTHTPKTYRLVI